MDRTRRPVTTEDWIRAAVHKFCAPRSTATVFAGGRRINVHGTGERILVLPNGHRVRVSVDDSGCATQIEEDEHLHAIARPHAIRNPHGASSTATAAHRRLYIPHPRRKR